MTKMVLAATLATLVVAALPPVATPDSGHGAHAGGEAGRHGGHGAGVSQPAGPAGAWAALVAARAAIAADVEAGALKDIHAKAEPLPDLVAALLEQSDDLDAGKRARVEGAAKQIARVAEALHEAADGGEAARTRRELSRLDGLLELIRVQYPAGALGAAEAAHEGHAAEPEAGHRAHTHAERPVGVIDSPPRATLRVQALDPFRFEPSRIELQAGVPTRIEFENAGAIEHALVVRTPDGALGWVHLHAAPGATEAATYELDQTGTFPVLCTIPGHTEAGMVGEIVVSARDTEESRPHLRDRRGDGTGTTDRALERAEPSAGAP